MKLGVTWRERLGHPACPYLTRWVLNLGVASVRLHHWHAGDDPRAFHDHAWAFATVVLRGAYDDVTAEGSTRLAAGSVRFRRPRHRHTVAVAPGGCWTLLVTGPVVRRWGFWVKGKFMKPNKYFLRYKHHPCE